MGRMSTEEQIKEDIKIDEPSQYAVVILNDDYTPTDFVTALLQKVFHLPLEKAELLTTQVHEEGKTVAGIYSFEVSETKSQMCNNLSSQEGYPLQTVVERA